MKSDEERGPFAAWLRREVRARKWKEAEARQRFEAAADPGVSFSSYRDLEAGNRKPTTAQRKAIAAVLGPIPAFSEVGESDLAVAIRLQAEAMNKMTEAINVAALAVLTSQATVHGGQVALGDLLGRLAAGETLAELARSLRNGPD